jgi:hypothetical protein
MSWSIANDLINIKAKDDVVNRACLEYNDLDKVLNEKNSCEHKLEYLYNTWCEVQNINSFHAILIQRIIYFRAVLLTYNNNFDLMNNTAKEMIRTSSGRFLDF